MPIFSVTTTAIDVFSGDVYLQGLTFKNGSSTGTIFIRNKRNNDTEVASSSYEHSLGPGDGISFTSSEDGESIRGPWRAISDTGGGVTLEILPTYLSQRRV